MMKSNLAKSKEKLSSLSSFNNKNFAQKPGDMTRSSSKSSLNLTKDSERLQTSKSKINTIAKKVQTAQMFKKGKEKSMQRQTSSSKDRNKQNLKPSALNIKQQSSAVEPHPKGKTVKDIRNNLVKGSKASNIKISSPSKPITRTLKDKPEAKKEGKQMQKVEDMLFGNEEINIKILTPRPSQKKQKEVQQPNSILKYIPPQVLAEYSKVSASDFHFISTTQAHSYFKDVLAHHLVLNALFTVRIVDKVSVEKQQLKSQLIQSITIQLFLNKFHLPHLLTLYTIFQDANFIYLVMEPLLIQKQVQESLLEQIPYQGKINENLISLRMKELATTINQVHKYSIVLRDLNVDFLRVQLGVLKITLIDSAARLGKRKRRQSFLGDVQKIPQELALGKSYSNLYDTWNLGILLYMLSTGVKPFVGKNALNEIKQINYLLPINTSKELTELIFRLLIEQSQRLTAAQVLDHRFLEFNLREKTMVVRDLWAFWHYQN